MACEHNETGVSVVLSENVVVQGYATRNGVEAIGGSRSAVWSQPLPKCGTSSTLSSLSNDLYHNTSPFTRLLHDLSHLRLSTLHADTVDAFPLL